MGDSQSKQFGNDYLDKLSGQLDKKAPVFGKSLFAGAGDATKNAWSAGTAFGNDVLAHGGLNDPMRSAMDSFGQIGSGYGAAADRSRSALAPISQGFGSAMAGSDSMLNPVYSGYGGLTANGGLNGAQSSAMSGLGGLGSQYAGLGQAYDPNSSAYQTLRNGLSRSVLADVASLGASNGRYGSESFNRGAAEGLGNALAGLDYSNMQNNINNQYRSLDSQRGIFGDQFGMAQTGVGNQLAGLAGQGNTANSIFGNRAQGLGAQAGIANSIFGNDAAALAGQQGAASSLFNAGQTAFGNQQNAIDQLTQIGAARDANAQGKLLGQADLFDRTKNAELDRLIKIGAAFGDPVAAANEPPWWQQMLGYAMNNAGKAASAFGGGG